MKHYAQDGTLMLETDDDTGKVLLYSDLSKTVQKPETELCEICLRHSSDKCGNGYTAFYHKYFTPIRNEVKKVLEIGVSAGFSMKMWYEYFPNAMIYGIDKPGNMQPDKVKSLLNDRTDVRLVDQTYFSGLNFLLKEWGDDFDIILDDGSHMQRDQQLTMGWLFPYVRVGGFYIIEDLCAVNSLCNNETQLGQQDRLTGSDSTCMFLDNMRKGIFKSSYLSKSYLHYLEKTTEGVEFCFGTALGTEQNLNPYQWGGAMTCLVKKRINNEPYPR